MQFSDDFRFDFPAEYFDRTVIDAFCSVINCVGNKHIPNDIRFAKLSMDITLDNGTMVNSTYNEFAATFDYYTKFSNAMILYCQHGSSVIPEYRISLFLKAGSSWISCTGDKLETQRDIKQFIKDVPAIISNITLKDSTATYEDTNHLLNPIIMPAPSDKLQSRASISMVIDNSQDFITAPTIMEAPAITIQTSEDERQYQSTELNKEMKFNKKTALWAAIISVAGVLIGVILTKLL